ncbi:MAG TPA: hypothetical protein VGN24_09285 [Rhodanobacter sp.]|jgi:hypothetical protein|nr:hypothetical protein [Rhodanobacter sp.]
MNTLKKLMGIAAVLVLGVLACGTASASPVTTIWGNSAGDGLYQYDLATGNLLQSFDPASTFDVSWNGRGVVQVGNTLYLTNASDNNVYKMNATTGASEGVGFSITGASGLSAIAYDGANFWVADYSGSDKAYLYSPTGTLIKTISLTNCSGFCDGLEFFNGKLIENRFDGGFGGANQYDVYDTAGNIVTADFFTSTSSASTGIAFDGADFWTSNIFDGSLSQWDGATGAFIGNLKLQTPRGSFEIEDLSVNYSQVIPPTNVPEPEAPALFSLGVLLIGLFTGLRRRFN